MIRLSAVACTLTAGIFAGGLANAQCCGCAPTAFVSAVGSATRAAINGATSAEVATATLIDTSALQGHAAQVSANIRGVISAQGMIAEAVSSQDTLRLVQGDRAAAAKANQFSTPLCQAATGATIAIAQQAEAAPATMLRASANAMRTAGLQRPENPHATAQVSAANFLERRPLFCDSNDPACRGTAGQRPQGDRMPGAMLTLGRFANPEDRAQAAWLVQNLTQPVPVPALSARQVEQAGGREAYLRRGGDEAKLNLAKDVATNILLTRREPTAHPSWYNSLAAEAGLPLAPGMVSMEDTDRMRYRDRFTATYSTRLAGLGDPVPLYRELAALLADQNSQYFRTNELLQDDVMLVSAILSTMVQPRLEQASGTMK